MTAAQLADAERLGAELLALLTAQGEAAEQELERGLFEIAAQRVSDALLTLGQLGNLMTPARRDLSEAGSASSAAVARTGGPVKPIRARAGEGPTPCPAVAVAAAARESRGLRQGQAGASFSLPVWPGTVELAASINRSVRAELARRPS